MLDIYPAGEGHVVLMPKKHLQVMPQMPPDLTAKFGVACKKVSGMILGAFNAKGTSVFIANGLHAGQKAPHFMAHIIPRAEGDSVSLNPAMREITLKDFEEVKSKLAVAGSGRAEINEAPGKKERGKEEADLDAVSRLFE